MHIAFARRFKRDVRERRIVQQGERSQTVPEDLEELRTATIDNKDKPVRWEVKASFVQLLTKVLVGDEDGGIADIPADLRAQLFDLLKRMLCYGDDHAIANDRGDSSQVS